MALHVKKEAVDQTALDELCGKIVNICAKDTLGITDDNLQAAFPGVGINTRVTAINKLLSESKITILKSGNKIVYRVKESIGASSSGAQFANQSEQIVYHIIESGGNKGVWVRDIRFKANLLQAQLNKVLKTLEVKKLVKAIHSVGTSKRKIYMLYDRVPDQSLTGGAWYSDQDFESEFVDILNQQCYRFLEQKLETASQNKSLSPLLQAQASSASSEDVAAYISELGISKIKLSLLEIETVLDTLVYDGKAVKELVPRKDGPSLKNYRAIGSLVENSPLMRNPCGICPVVKDCHVGGVISPANCKYLDEWLA